MPSTTTCVCFGDVFTCKQWKQGRIPVSSCFTALSLNVELGWKWASPSHPPVSVSHSINTMGMYAYTRFLCGCWGFEFRSSFLCNKNSVPPIDLSSCSTTIFFPPEFTLVNSFTGPVLLLSLPLTFSVSMSPANLFYRSLVMHYHFLSPSVE